MAIYHTENEDIVDNPHNNRIHFILHWNQVNFDPPHWNKVNSNKPHKMQVKEHAQTKNKWCPTRVQKQNHFHPLNNQVHFHPPTKNKIFSASIEVITQFLPPTQQPKSI